MLALVMAVALAQCTKDTDCKGDRICSAGSCVDSAAPAAPRIEPTPQPLSVEPSAEAVAAQRVRIVKIGRLEAELRDLREELDDATVGGPIVKLIGATALVGLAVALFYTWDSNPNGTAAMFWSAIGSGVLAAGLYVWGGVQMRLRLNAQRELPLQISEKELEIAQLRAMR